MAGVETRDSLTQDEGAKVGHYQTVQGWQTMVRGFGFRIRYVF